MTNDDDPPDHGGRAGGDRPDRRRSGRSSGAPRRVHRPRHRDQAPGGAAGAHREPGGRRAVAGHASRARPGASSRSSSRASGGTSSNGRSGARNARSAEPGSWAVSADIIDGKAFAARLRGRIAEAVADLKREGRPRAGPRGGAGGRGSRQSGLCAEQGSADAGGRDGLRGASPAGDDRAGGVAGAHRPSQRRSEGSRHPGATAAAGADRHGGGDRSGGAGEGRGRVSRHQCRAARHRPEGAGALHAAGLPHAAARPAGRSERRDGGGARALEHRRQAHGATPAGRELHGDDRPFQDPRSGGDLRARRHPRRGRRTARKWSRAIG